MNQQKKKMKSAGINWPANAIAYINELEAKLAGANINATRYQATRAMLVDSFGYASNFEFDKVIDDQIKKDTKNV